MVAVMVGTWVVTTAELMADSMADWMALMSDGLMAEETVDLKVRRTVVRMVVQRAVHLAPKMVGSMDIQLVHY